MAKFLEDGEHIFHFEIVSVLSVTLYACTPALSTTETEQKPQKWAGLRLISTHSLEHSHPPLRREYHAFLLFLGLRVIFSAAPKALATNNEAKVGGTVDQIAAAIFPDFRAMTTQLPSTHQLLK